MYISQATITLQGNHSRYRYRYLGTLSDKLYPEPHLHILIVATLNPPSSDTPRHSSRN